MSIKKTDHTTVNRDLSTLATKSMISTHESSAKKGQKAKDRKRIGYDVDLSNKSIKTQNEHKKALEIARATPDVRMDKVNALKEQIKNGTYKVDSGKIADGMLREAVLDHLALTDQNSLDTL